MQNNIKQNSELFKHGIRLLILLFFFIIFFLIYKWNFNNTTSTSDTETIQKKERVTKVPQFQKAPDPNMVFVEGGSFIMGSMDEEIPLINHREKPSHEVTVPSFYMGKYEVTNEEFLPFLNAKGNQKEKDGAVWVTLEGDKWSKIECGIRKINGKFEVKEGEEKLPMVYVSWYGANAYAKWLKEKTGKEYRLPTEAEWEYAAGGGQKTKKYKFAGSNNLEEVSWYEDNADGSFHNVGTKKKGNELGLYDMSGNVWEWVEDCHAVNYNWTPRDGTAWTEAACYIRIFRGGSWDSEVRYNKITYRNAVTIKAGLNNLGFRLAQSQ